MVRVSPSDPDKIGKAIGRPRGKFDLLEFTPTVLLVYLGFRHLQNFAARHGQMGQRMIRGQNDSAIGIGDESVGFVQQCLKSGNVEFDRNRPDEPSAADYGMGVVQSGNFSHPTDDVL